LIPCYLKFSSVSVALSKTSFDGVVFNFSRVMKINKSL
jgi:hypothetical protein